MPENWRREVAKVLTENSEMDSYITKLKLDNEVLQSKNDELRDKLYSAHNTIYDLQSEVLRLKSLLVKNGIQFE